jgi:hypothetical protein
MFTKDALHCFGPKAEDASVPPSIPPPAPLAAVHRSDHPAPGGAGRVRPAARGSPQGFTVRARRHRPPRARGDRAKSPGQIHPAHRPREVRSRCELTGDGHAAGPDEDVRRPVQAKWNNLAAVSRGRVVAGIGYRETFEPLPLTRRTRTGDAVGFPPLPWLGARVKWHVIEKEGGKVVGNRLDSIMFMRTMNFIVGDRHEELHLRGRRDDRRHRRIMSNVGLVNQRYLIALAANNRILEVSSNHERLKESVPFSATQHLVPSEDPGRQRCRVKGAGCAPSCGTAASRSPPSLDHRGPAGESPHPRRPGRLRLFPAEPETRVHRQPCHLRP